MDRDRSLIALAGVIVIVAMVCATVLVVAGHADPVAGFAVITGSVGIGGVALGRLGGPPQPEQRG